MGARTAEAPFEAAQEELEAAAAELKAQEEAYENKKQELQTKGEGSGVGAMRARNELAQLLAEDPLPLRRAKITQEAALKKAEKATNAAAVQEKLLKNLLQLHLKQEKNLKKQ